MKKFIVILAAIILSLSAVAQSQKSLVTDQMTDKIAEACLCGKGYAKAIFYQSNASYLSYSDIANGRGLEILENLNRYKDYVERFIVAVWEKFGAVGFRDMNFTEDEIKKAEAIYFQKE